MIAAGRALRAGVVLALTLVAMAACGGTSAGHPGLAARVGSRDIPLSLYNLRLQAVFAQLGPSSSAAHQGSSQTTMEKQVRANVMRSLIIDTVVAEEAAFRGVGAKDSDVDAEITSDAKEAGGQDALVRQLSDQGVSLDELRDEIRSRLNEQRLEDVFARARATQALAELDSGKSFADVARTYSDDATSKDKGGDLGSIKLSDLQSNDPALAKAVVSLSVGQRTKTPARDQEGYEILQLDAVNGDNRSLHRILVAAPNPYTARERPSWFLQSVFAALADYCSRGEITVYAANAGPPPCPGATPTPSRRPTSAARPGASPRAPSPSPSPSPR
ncbi:MAG TPA: peptidylprolyl isomerase [Candidatus Sulfotelmatobacter sp.]|nr:peptidylprolyl isomerase [Candidatus Sulfotelmatobacter sp.]